MTETETDQLEVPEAAYDAWCQRDDEERSATDHVRAIAAPVVAAELTRWADELMGDGYDVVARNIQRRADELGGGGRG